MPKNWSTIPWEKHGVFAMTSGTPNTNPDPTAQALAQDAIHKATVSAHRGITTILLLELQADLDLFPRAKKDNRTIQMLKLITIPAGRLAQWKGYSNWTANFEKGTLTSADQTADRPKHSSDSNRFPVFMLAYGPKADTSFNIIDRPALLELTHALAACSNPKPTTKDEKKIIWHNPSSQDQTTLLSIPYFGTQTTSTTITATTTNPEGMNDEEPSLPEDPPKISTTSRPSQARIIAGKASDTARLIDRMQALRAASLLDALGTPLGSLRAHHRAQQQIQQCPCCKAQSSAGVSLPQPPPGHKELANISNRLKQKIYKNYVTYELSEWAHPTQDPDWNSSPGPEPPDPPSPKRPTRQPKNSNDPAPRSNIKGQPEIPYGILQTLVRAIKTTPITVCFACAIPYVSTLQKPLSGQDPNLATWKEVCRLAQGLTPALSLIPPQQWAKRAYDPLGKGEHRNIEGRNIALSPPHALGNVRTGHILLVSKTKKGGKPQAIILLDEKPTPEDKCVICTRKTPSQEGKTSPAQARACSECNQTYHKKCIPEDQRPAHFPNGIWNCPKCQHVLTPTPQGLLYMSITSAHKAITSHATYAANLRTNEEEERAKISEKPRTSAQQ
jgi:ribosomal protein L37AE/L43A